MWIQTRVTVRKRLSWVLTSVTLTFDLWPWPFAWTSLLSLVITPENFMMIWWWEHGEKGVTDRRTDRWTDWTSHIAAWSSLKKSSYTAGHSLSFNILHEQTLILFKQPQTYYGLMVIRHAAPPLLYVWTGWTLSQTSPDSKVDGAHLGLTGPRWAPCLPQELCYLGHTEL